MSVLDIKNDLLRLLVETNDEHLLDKVRRYFKALKKEPVSKEELEIQEDALIETGLQQIENGKVISHEEAKRRIQEHLAEKMK